MLRRLIVSVFIVSLFTVNARADGLIAVKSAAMKGDVVAMKRLLGSRHAIDAPVKKQHRQTKKQIDYRLATPDGFEFLVRLPAPGIGRMALMQGEFDLIDFEPYSVEQKLFWYPVFTNASAQ